VNVFCLGCEQIDSLWPAFGHHLERYELEGYDYAEAIRADLRIAQKQLWGLQGDDGKIAGIVVTKITDTPKGSRCDIHAACGTSQGIKQAIELVLPCIEEWAKAIGCTGVRVEGRMGWKRVLDYPQAGVILEKEL